MSVPVDSEEIVLRWTPERKDMIEAVVAQQFRTIRRPRFVTLALGLCVVVYVATAVTQFVGLPPVDSIPTMLVVLALALAVLVSIGPLLLWLCLIAAVSFQWRRNATLHEPIEAVLRPSGLVLKNSQMETKMRWTAISEVSEGRRAYRLHLKGRRSAFPIPKRAMPGADGAVELGKLLRRLMSTDAVPRTPTTL